MCAMRCFLSCAPRLSSVGTGLLGIMGNKGAVAASLAIHSTSLCVVCAHLASGSSAVDARNLEYAVLLQRLTFSGDGGESGEGGEGGGKHGVGATGGGASGSSAGGSTSGHHTRHGGGGDDAEAAIHGVLGHDCVVWFGDLNYRISLDGEATRSMAARGELTSLRAHDQLLAAQRSGAVFGGFVEAPLDFPPTYKYDIQSDAFDTSEKRRPPAWCDRVLWRVGHAGGAFVECDAYRSHDVRTSDHRPVSSALRVGVRVTNAVARQMVLGQITKALDAWENSCVPSASIDVSEVDFGCLAKRSGAFVT